MFLLDICDYWQGRTKTTWYSGWKLQMRIFSFSIDKVDLDDSQAGV